MSADDISPGKSRRLFVTDESSKTRFLIDTELPQPRAKTTYELFAANGTVIPTYGTQILNLSLGLRRQFTWRFVIADAEKPIIGADFLAHYGLLVDLQKQRLLDQATHLTSQGEVIECEVLSIKTVTGTSRFHELLQRYPEITRPDGATRSIQHSTKHHILTTPGPPVAQKPRRLAPDKLKIAKADFCTLVKLGIAQPSKAS
ncbi:uncharacterized protein LOC127289472 [Leptopilina boulardi]|uniref:uncharacterized protein LOC127289472 n=1 Tax=Leptopilina boulardi TaxID=63433 RepID=UPI0021F622BA|nr:uncharacterized protein LOC127289472 [Leptopilina boulardi]